MRLELGCLVLPVIALAACASSPEVETATMSNKGMVTVAGVSPAQALGAVDTSKLVAGAPVATASSNPETLPEGQNAIAIEGVKPSDVLAAIDTSKLVDKPVDKKAKPKP